MNRREMKRRVQLLCSASMCAALASCIPTAKEPLSDATKAQPVKDLVGVWTMERGEQTRYLMIGRLPVAADAANQVVPRGLMAYQLMSIGKDGTLSRDGDGVFFVSRFKDETYANLFETNVVQEAQKVGSWSYPASTPFILIRYRLEKNALVVAYLDKDRAKDAINKGAIEGRITKGMGSDEEVVLDGGARLAKYLSKEGGKGLFPEEASEKWRRAKVVPER